LSCLFTINMPYKQFISLILIMYRIMNEYYVLIYKKRGNVRIKVKVRHFLKTVVAVQKQ